ncbi:hypothetical protein [Lysobacter gummosus]|uniref:hypothetical protein n=1 Tax=Lysobacter gummosus TaxID=262324 RepID=UPI003644E258
MPLGGAAMRRSGQSGAKAGCVVFARHSRERGLRFTSAEPNIQRLQAFSHERHWIPAFAGMTFWKDDAEACGCSATAEVKRSLRSRE